MYNNAFAGKRVFVTGHTGFKGTWLCIYLQHLGAKITGYALQPPTDTSIFKMTGLQSQIDHIEGDIRDYARLNKALTTSKPDFIFHLAAQPLVLESYASPRETFDVNVIGTISLLDAVRSLQQPCTVIIVSTDKCYLNNEWDYGYRETDVLGGHDPYSASKAAMEIAVSSYRSSFFPIEEAHQHGVLIATVRAGNVIGGGDWAENRIVPDAIEALKREQPVKVRSPRSIRPWQHVLEPLSGYLWIAAKLADKTRKEFASSWNFGPFTTETYTVQDLIECIIECWGSGTWKDVSDPSAPHEASVLKLSIDKAHSQLGWVPVWSFKTAVQQTTQWYHDVAIAVDNTAARECCLNDINAFENSAREKHLPWTS